MPVHLFVQHSNNIHICYTIHALHNIHNCIQLLKEVKTKTDIGAISHIGLVIKCNLPLQFLCKCLLNCATHSFLLLHLCDLGTFDVV